MEIPRHIFKAYDIRGLEGKEVNVELAEAMGRAFVTFLKGEITDKETLTITVGRDMRESSPKLQEAVERGMVESGANVLDIGLVSTPAFYFGVGHTKADGGLMVTASHNPAAFNGFKMVRARAVSVSGKTGIQDIADIIEKDDYLSSDSTGKVKEVVDIPRLGVEAEIKHAQVKDIGSPKIIADSGNGMGAQYLDLLFENQGLDIERMYWELDGTFPNHESNPFKDENVADLKARVKESGADLGIATDGDGDRIFFIDNEGEMVEPAIIRGILAQIMLKRHPGSVICYDIRPGKITNDMIVEAGGVPYVTPVGHSYIKECMVEQEAVYGGESSGHFFYTFPHGTHEGPVTVVMQILGALHQSGKTLAEFVKPLRRYAHSGEINFDVDDKEGMIKKIKDNYQDGELNELDGITITYDDFWFNVRPSNTESKLRLNLEAIDEKTMEKHRDEIKKIIEAN